MSSPLPPVCVLGMHRSGTSAMGRVINLLGVSLGETQALMEPNEGNPKGYWEHKEVVAINDELLARMGGSWDSPPRLTEGWHLRNDLEDLRERGAQLVQSEMSQNKQWGWKDPRTSLTLPFWKEILGEIRYVICLRNPLNVAASLQKRDGMDVDTASRLWLHYTHAALQHTVSCSRLLILYEDLLKHPRERVTDVAAFVHADQTLVPEAASFIDEAEQHQGNTLSEAMRHQEVSSGARTTYLFAHSLMGAGVDATDALEDFCRIEIERNENTRSALAERDQSIDSLKDALRPSSNTILELTSELHSSQAQIGALDERHQRDRAQIDHSQKRIVELSEQTATLQGEVNGLNLALNEYHHILKQLEGAPGLVWERRLRKAKQIVVKRQFASEAIARLKARRWPR